MFDPTEISKLKLVSKVLSIRVNVWMQMKYLGPKIRHSLVVCQNNQNGTVYEFPKHDEITKMLSSRVLHFLVGFQNNHEDGTGIRFNFIMSNGLRSSLKFVQTDYEHMIPKEAQNKIKSIVVHYY